MPADRAFSCVIPAYNNFDARRIHLSMSSVLSQDCEDTEVIIVESNQEPQLESVGGQKGVKYVFIPAETSFNTGTIRNFGVLAATRPLLYLTDGDIVFQRTDFLSSVADALTSAPDRVLRRPPMRRLLMDSFDPFWRRYLSDGLMDALNALDRSSPYVATAEGSPPRLRVVSPLGKEGVESWTTTEEMYRLYKSRPELKNLVPLIFCGTRHWGGVALRRAHFDKVGGYAPSFTVWGNEDTDLQWKLGERFNMDFFPDEISYEVLHIDHEKPYFTPETWQRNKTQVRLRTEQGVAISIEQDRTAYESLGWPNNR